MQKISPASAGSARRMSSSFLATAVAATGCAAIALSASAGGGGTLYRTGFEPTDSPAFVLGDLNGQNGWTVELENAVGSVVDTTVRSGAQSVEIIDAASHGRGELLVDLPLSESLLMTRCDIYVPFEWGFEQFAVRFEAQAAVEFETLKGENWRLEFGLVKTEAPYGTLPANSAGYYIEAVTDGEVVLASYSEVDYATVADAWHRYRIDLDRFTGEVSLRVDNNADVASLMLPVTVSKITALKLENQRWATDEKDNKPLYFDNLRAIESPGDQIILPESFVRVRGLEVTGELSDLFDNDDSYVITKPDVFQATTDPPVNVRVLGTSPITNPSVLRMVIESRANVQNIRQRVRLFNFETRDFEILDSRLATVNEDGQLIFEITTNPSRFIRPANGRIRLEIDYNAIAFSIAPVWHAWLDRVNWQVAP